MALHEMDGELGAHLKKMIRDVVSPPVLKKLDGAVAVATDDADVDADTDDGATATVEVE